MAKKPAAKAAPTEIIEREPLTIAEVATLLELSLMKLNGVIKDCPSDAVKKVLKTVAGNLSDIIEADIVLSLRPIDTLLL